MPPTTPACAQLYPSSGMSVAMRMAVIIAPSAIRNTARNSHFMVAKANRWERAALRKSFLLAWMIILANGSMVPVGISVVSVLVSSAMEAPLGSGGSG